MKLFIAAYYELIKNLRDIKMAVMFILFPLFMILILGNTVEKYLLKDSGKKISVGCVNKDSGVTGKAFDKFTYNEEIKKRLDIKYYDDINIAQHDLKDGKINNLIYIPVNLSENILKGNKESIELYGNKDTEFLESLISGFTSYFNAENTAITMAGKPVDISTTSNIKTISFTKSVAAPRAIDYYSVLTLLMVLLMGAIFGVFITLRQRQSDIHIRLHSLPISSFQLICGKILGSILYLFIAAIITILFTKIFYDANWNGNPIVIILTILMFCSIVVGFGVLIGLLVNNYSTALIIVFLFALFFGSFSGAVSPANTLSSTNFLIPNYNAKVLLFGTIYGYSWKVMYQAGFWLLVMLLLIYGIAAFRIRRVSYDNI